MLRQAETRGPWKRCFACAPRQPFNGSAPSRVRSGSSRMRESGQSASFRFFASREPWKREVNPILSSQPLADFCEVVLSILTDEAGPCLQASWPIVGCISLQAWHARAVGSSRCGDNTAVHLQEGSRSRLDNAEKGCSHVVVERWQTTTNKRTKKSPCRSVCVLFLFDCAAGDDPSQPPNITSRSFSRLKTSGTSQSSAPLLSTPRPWRGTGSHFCHGQWGCAAPELMIVSRFFTIAESRTRGRKMSWWIGMGERGEKYCLSVCLRAVDTRSWARDIDISYPMEVRSTGQSRKSELPSRRKPELRGPKGLRLVIDGSTMVIWPEFNAGAPEALHRRRP